MKTVEFRSVLNKRIAIKFLAANWMRVSLPSTAAHSGARVRKGMTKARSCGPVGRRKKL
jgi:hypothetical protein